MTSINQAIDDAAMTAAIAVVTSPTNGATTHDTYEIKQSVTDAVAPLIVNATNNEPWYQSRVTLGSLLAAAGGLAAALGYAFPAETQSKVIDLIIAASALIGPALALYGRWIAKKPIGA